MKTSLIAIVLATAGLTAFAADTAKAPAKAASAPVVINVPAKKVVKPHKSTKAVKPAAAASAPVTPAK
jgi:hypothetical protein